MTPAISPKTIAATRKRHSEGAISGATASGQEAARRAAATS